MSKIESDTLVVVVVWYNPNAHHAKLLQQFLINGLQIIIIDNSETDNSALLPSTTHTPIHYLPNHENKGIANALTTACRHAHAMGAAWVLTMDQDSEFASGDIERYVQLANEYDDEMVAIFAPMHNTHGKVPRVQSRYTPCDKVMTSGNLVSMEIFEKTGNHFCDDFFIDSVDDEYCYRVQRYGYHIVQINDIVLRHALGDIVEARCCGIKKKIHIHAPIRYYYIVRNLLKLADLYPEHKRETVKILRKILRKTLKRTLFYNYPQKWVRWHYIRQGWRDYKQGISGKYRQKR